MKDAVAREQIEKLEEKIRHLESRFETLDWDPDFPYTSISAAKMKWSIHDILERMNEIYRFLRVERKISLAVPPKAKLVKVIKPTI